jgi:hypothetical protein
VWPRISTREAALANQAARKFEWHEALLADTELPDEAKVLGGWLMHRFDSDSLIAVIAAPSIAEDLGWSVSKVTRAVKALREAPWIEVWKGRFCNCYSPAFDLVQHIDARMALVREARRARYPIGMPRPKKTRSKQSSRIAQGQQQK